MTNFIAEAFKRMMGFVAGAFLILSVVIGVGTWIATGGAWQGWLALIAGPLFVILTFGSLALVIQNNRLLQRIADGQQHAKAGEHDAEQRAPQRREPALRANQ